jgi:hypothetical protein
MSKASESKLATLHGVVADVLTAQLNHTQAETTFDEAGEMVETGEVVHTATPATLAAAIKFLKDNQITCDIETNENMNNLRETLAKKQKRSRLTDAKEAANELPH